MPLSYPLLDALHECETELSRLYAMFVIQLPEMAAFWNELVMEECAHATVLEQLDKALLAGRLTFKPQTMAIQAVQTTVGFIRRTREQAEADGTTPVKALAQSVGLEESMIEQRFYSVFGAESIDMKREFAALHNHTNEHILRIKMQLEEARKSRR